MSFRNWLAATAVVAICGSAGAAVLPQLALAEENALTLSAAEIAKQTSQGGLKPCEAARAALVRIASDRHNAFIRTQTLEELSPCSSIEPSASGAMQRLRGVPIAIKDNVLVAGLPATFGTSSVRDFVPAQTASAVQRLVDAGAVIIGKLNMHELAGGVTSNNAVFGPVRNAYDEAYFAGGSSGGAGAAVGARLAPVALGTDTGGSVLIPAALNGVVGYRPSVGRYPMDGVLPVSSSRDTIGPVARSVADIVLVDAVISGTSGDLAPAPLSGMRIGVPRELFVRPADAESRRQFETVLTILRQAGVELIDVDLPGLPEAEKGYGPITPYELRTQVPIFLDRYHVGVSFDALVAGIRSPDLIKDYQTRIVGPGKPSQQAYDEAMRLYKPAVESAFHKAFADNRITALVFPTTLTDARPIEGSDETIAMDGERIPTWKAYINNTNYLTKGSLAALTLPMGLSSRGLPLGVTLAVPPQRDETLLALGLSVEKLLPRIPEPSAAAAAK